MRLLALLLLAALASPALAGRCLDEDTVEDCFERLSRQAQRAQLAPLRQAQQLGQRAALQQRETGIDTGLVASSLKNFLPLLSFSGLVGSGGDAAAQSRSPLALDLNFLVPEGAQGHNGQLQLETLGQGTLARPLKQQLEQAGQTELIGRLEDELNAFADSAASFSYSFQHYGFGREFEDYSARLDALMLQVSAASIGDAEREAHRRRRQLLRERADYLPDTGGNFRFEDIDCASVTGRRCTAAREQEFARVRAEIMSAVADSAEQFGAGTRAVQEGVTQAGIDRFVDLVNNQPQLTLVLRRLIRDPLVGAELTSARLSYEWGAANLRRFERGPGRVCARGGEDWANAQRAAGRDCLQAYANYVHAQADVLRDSPRWAASAEYADIGELDIVRAGDDIDLHLPGAQRWAAALSYGRYLQLLPQALPGSTRLDAQARYEHYSGALLHGERYVAQLVLTQKLAGLSLPFTLFYRSRDEFDLSGSDDLGGLVGLNYDLFGSAPALPPLPEVAEVVHLLH